jgi:hypothetical protein
MEIRPRELSQDEYENSMKKYLQDHRIDRACWELDGNPVDVNKSFQSLDCRDKLIIGHEFHTKKCDASARCRDTRCCDLIEYIIGYDGRYQTYRFRYDSLDFWILIEPGIQYEGYLRVPAMCGKQMILDALMSPSPKDSYILDTDKNLLKSYSTQDFDLYHITKYMSEDETISEYRVDKITTESEIVIKFGCVNRYEIIDDEPNTEYAYVIVCKSMRLCEFYKVIPLIKDLAQIVHSYVDFESIKPNPCEYF